MTLFGLLARTAAIAGLLLAGCFAAAPAYAGKAEVALLESYIGAWKGRGVLVGAETETVICRLTLSKGNEDKVNYSGRCALAGQNLSVKGTLAYIDSKRRFEAAMTSNATFSGTAIGQKSGEGVLFNLRESGEDEAGNDMTITASIALNKSKIMVEFNVVFNETGDSLRAQVPFTK